MSARYICTPLPFLKRVPCLSLSVKDRLWQSALFLSHDTTLLPPIQASMYDKDGSIHPIPYIALFPSEFTKYYHRFYILDVQRTYCQQLALCVFLRHFPCSLYCMPYSPLQNSETWLMFQVFSHMYQTITIESEKLSGLGVVDSNST